MNTLSIPDHVTAPFFGLEDRWIETGEGELTHFHDLGSGEPILFLHGSGNGVTAAANWWLNLKDISRWARCVAIDALGYGQTIVPEGASYGIREWVAHAVRVLDALGIQKTWIVGNSLGGWIALQLAIDHPERVHGVISMGTGGGQATTAVKGLASTEMSEDGIRRTLELFVVDKTIVTDELVKLRYQTALHDKASDRFKDVTLARERDREAMPLTRDTLSGISIPVLLVHGLQDIIVPVGRTYDLLGMLPSADAHIFNQCGHWSQVERADDFNAIVKLFITRRS